LNALICHGPGVQVVASVPCAGRTTAKTRDARM
jgi:hypothetical protein